MVKCRVCNCNCDPSDIVGGICDDCRMDQEKKDKSHEQFINISNGTQLELNLIEKGNSMKLKTMRLTDFKGVRSAEYDFSDFTRVLGQNGSGKTTIMTAWFWVWCDKDSALSSNPPIRPNDDRECIPSVQLILDFDGKEVTLEKQQKRKDSKPDAKGIVKTTLTNEYIVNSVPKTERDFKAYFEDLGIEFDKLLHLSHTDAYTGQKQADMRKILFSMANDISDYDIANGNESMGDISVFLKDYKFEEIEAMQKASLKKSNEQIGSIPDQIIGMEKSKVDIDVAELELQRNELNRQIISIESKQSDVVKQYEEYDNASKGVLDIKFEMSNFERDANSELFEKRKKISDSLDNKKAKLQDVLRLKKNAQDDLNKYRENVECLKGDINEAVNEWKSINNEEFDESSTICPTCAQTLPDERIASIRADYESNKESRKSKINTRGQDCKKKITDLTKNIEEAELEIGKAKLNEESLTKEIESLEKKLLELPEKVDVSSMPEYIKLSNQLEEKETFMNKQSSAENTRNELSAQKKELQAKLNEVNAKIAKSENNVRIDEQIEELREQQLKFEQAKADAEKILYQLSLLSKKKNELLVEDINSHFSVVKWKLFETFKNGEYKEVCIPMIDGFEFGRHTNTGRELIAKLDICDSLQKFFGMNVPVFLDGAESLNEFNIPNMGCQVILLKVTDDTELTIAKEN